MRLHLSHRIPPPPRLLIRAASSPSTLSSRQKWRARRSRDLLSASIGEDKSFWLRAMVKPTWNSACQSSRRPSFNQVPWASSSFLLPHDVGRGRQALARRQHHQVLLRRSRSVETHSHQESSVAYVGSGGVRKRGAHWTQRSFLLAA